MSGRTKLNVIMVCVALVAHVVYSLLMHGIEGLRNGAEWTKSYQYDLMVVGVFIGGGMGVALLLSPILKPFVGGGREGIDDDKG